MQQCGCNFSLNHIRLSPCNWGKHGSLRHRGRGGWFLGYVFTVFHVSHFIASCPTRPKGLSSSVQAGALAICHSFCSMASRSPLSGTLLWQHSGADGCFRDGDEAVQCSHSGATHLLGPRRKAAHHRDTSDDHSLPENLWKPSRGDAVVCHSLPAVLGSSWLRRHNPQFNWSSGVQTGWSTSFYSCLQSAQSSLPVCRVPSSELPDLSSVQEVYHNLAGAFSKECALIATASTL